jgi:CTP synthase
LRLGIYPCKLSENTRAYEAYQDEVIYERHRHRYEFNNHYRQEFEKHGFVFSGTSPDGRLVEIIELKDHPWFVASQFHPEFKSRPTRPQPLFREFVHASLKNAEKL